MFWYMLNVWVHILRSAVKAGPVQQATGDEDSLFIAFHRLKSDKIESKFSPVLDLL
jgi:hypothetical protein